MKKLGIITGSGPEAGIDFWQKFLLQNRNHFGDSFKGDLQVPNTYIHSISRLGLSMELPIYEEEIWNLLSNQIILLDQFCDFFVITCNTLHYFENRIRTLPIKMKFISIVDILKKHVLENGINNFSILGSKFVSNLENTYSPFQQLTEMYSVENIHESLRTNIHDLIFSVKINGIKPYHEHQLNKILGNIESQYCYLACTELPLINISSNKITIDLTDLLCKEAIRLIHAPSS